MANLLEGLSETVKWRLLVNAAKKAAIAAGYELERVPGRGLSNIYTATKDGSSQKVSIRTTRDRWFAFPPLEKGSKWKTLSEVDMVIVASVDSKEEPENVEVYIFPANEVRQRFNSAYAARIKDGQTVRDNFGMWVSLGRDDRGIAASVGSGIGDKYGAVAVYSILDLLTNNPHDEDGDPQADDIDIATNEMAVATTAPMTIGDVLADTRNRIAQIAGVKPDAVRLDLKIEY